MPAPVGKTKPPEPKHSDVVNNPANDLPTAARPVLSYVKPDAWELGPDHPMRWATFRIGDSQSKAEVIVAKAKDVPKDNAVMWAEQITKQTDSSVIGPLAEQVVELAEVVPASGDKQAKLYSIHPSDQPDSPSLLVVAIPTSDPGFSVFVKLVADLKTSEQQKSNLLNFVNSLKWE